MQSLAIVKYPCPYAVVNDTYEMANDTKRLPYNRRRKNSTRPLY